MRKVIFALILGLVSAALSAPARAASPAAGFDGVRAWNELAFNAVRASRASDADAARWYAMLNAAMYDAVNGIIGGHGAPARAHALVAGPGPRDGDPFAAAVTAAHAVLVAVDPARAATYDAQRDADLSRAGAGHRQTAGARWGDEVGRQVVRMRADDGSAPVLSQPAGTGPGVFRAEWSGVQYRDVRPFAVRDPGVFVPGPPPALDSVEYAAAFAEVAVLGDARVPAPDLLATYQYWSVPAGSAQPPGEWLRIALTVGADRGLSLAQGTRMTALVSMASADTTVATVRTKYTYRHWRPTTAIREADTDGNPLTQPNPGWAARAGSVGGTPEWTSGHSSYSGVAATVLAGFFCSDNLRFTHATDTAPGGQARTYPGFSSAAAEAGRSRLFGGQHFAFSDRAGQGIGRGVGDEVLATRLLRLDGPTHVGACPR
ncbi:PA-phosphatase [Actinoplanes sp. ATCC 53533]|uniref:vanadium-dependent haloperoxidase n=1 Tax=Actinoplanes sp. ATCC 53533 TaxID=1288362 RepID=UPI000F7A6C56|nr:vanadium-dependent haloperoxidase [Actinoplanes sp. ATCC 53533]RSM56515.1 PA-phosphatase [Actinoplanes sp. ATCC 53533]